MAKNKNKGVRSGLEARIIEDLRQRGVNFEYEPFQLTYRKKVGRGLCGECGAHLVYTEHTYTPDLVLTDTGIIVEIKGNFKPSDRSKMEAVVKSNPDLDIRMLFQQDNYLTKRKVTTYTDWCQTKGIPFAVEGVPDEWC